MDDLTGQTIGQYRLMQKLGEGGMAEVYKAFQPRLDRYVAIKFIRPELAVDSLFRTRFENEARAIAKLSHGSIVHVYDFGEEERRYYLVMEFVEGQTLKDYLQKLHKNDQWVTTAQAVQIVTQVAGALGYAHDQGIIHRDVKPDNILLAGNGRAVLNDFGIAKMIEEGEGLTQTGAAIGTPAYMAPEQIQGQKARIGPPTDLYSLAIILYELLTGRTPFTADTAFAVMLKHLSDPIPLPRKINPHLPEGLELFVLKSLAKEPEDRYATAAEFIQALQAAVTDSPSATTTAYNPNQTAIAPAMMHDATEVAAPQPATVVRPSEATVVAASAPVEPAPASAGRRVPRWLWGVGGVLALAVILAIVLGGGDRNLQPPPLPTPPNLLAEGPGGASAAASAPATPGNGHIYFITETGLYKTAVSSGATPEALSPRLEAWLGEGQESEVAASLSGEWLLINTTRGDSECAGWACLTLVHTSFDPQLGGTVYLEDWSVVHPELGFAISPDGQDIIYAADGGPHEVDLWAIRHNQDRWGEPLLLTEDSDFEYHGQPHISNDGREVVMLCGDSPEEEDGVFENHLCRATTDGNGFDELVYADDGPIEAPEGENSLDTPFFLPDGGIIFATTWRNSYIWRYDGPGQEIAPFRSTPAIEDYLGCVLPDGRFATLQWREELAGPVLNIVDPRQNTQFTIETGVPVLYYVIACSQ